MTERTEAERIAYTKAVLWWDRIIERAIARRPKEFPPEIFLAASAAAEVKFLTANRGLLGAAAQLETMASDLRGLAQPKSEMQ